MINIRFANVYQYSGYQARFGRNIVSTTLALQSSVVESKRVWNWMASVRKYVDWKTYVEKTHDIECERMNLADLRQAPDWQAFGEWKTTLNLADLRQAADPNDD